MGNVISPNLPLLRTGEEPVHAFVISRRNRAECTCSWEGKPTKDKRKSWKAHVKRVDNR